MSLETGYPCWLEYAKGPTPYHGRRVDAVLRVTHDLTPVDASVNRHLRTYKSWVRALVFSHQFNESLFSQKSKVLPMKFTIATTILPLFLAHQAVGICPGFNYGIGNVQRLGNGINRCKCCTLPLTGNDDGLFRHLFFFPHRECL